MSLIPNSVNALAGISRSVPAGALFTGNSHWVSFPFITGMLAGHEECSLTNCQCWIILYQLQNRFLLFSK